MGTSLVHTESELARDMGAARPLPLYEVLRAQRIDGAALTLALTCVPISIAVAESFLSVALIARIVRCLRSRTVPGVPRIFWFWLAWAGAEIAAWLFSPQLRDGWSEIRHLLLIGGLFIVLPAHHVPGARLKAWRAVFFSSAVGSVFLIGDFVARLLNYHREIAAGDDVSFYLRTGGLLNNWMVYGTVEIVILAGLLSFWFVYPEERRRMWPVMALNAVAVLVSLTRTLWVASLLLLGIQLWWKRSRWLWTLPLLPLAAYALAPRPVRARLSVSMHAGYFSNAERLEMLRVGWRMVRQKPWTGVGPGRVDKLYRSYLSASEPVPAYHGHLHNNLAELAAEFGVPATLVGLLFVGALFRDLFRAARAAAERESRFLCQTAILALTGFLLAGCFDYTYGHSLALILLAFAVLSPLETRLRCGVSLSVSQ